MGEGYWRYWGKADPKIGGYHLAAFHCLDVAAVAFELLTRTAVLRRRCAALLALPEDKVVPTLAWLIALHDLGKFDLRFQMKHRPSAEALDPTRAAAGTWVGFDHGHEGYRVFDRLMNSGKPLAARLGSRRLVPLLHAVCAHHGALFAGNHADRGERPGAKHRDLDDAAQRAWLRDVSELFLDLGAALPWCPPHYPIFAAVEFVAGLCSVADWLGSYVRDEHAGVDYFTYDATPRPLAAYLEHARTVARRLLDDLPLFSATPGATSFSDLFNGWEPQGIQAVLANLPLPPGPGLAVIEAPMGDGKTEAALHLAARWMHQGDAAGVYFALPTMATSNGMFARMKEACEKLFGQRVNLRLAHGRARRHGPFQGLVQRRIRRVVPREDGEAETEAEVVSARWFLSRKRALLGQAGVGTVDQAMQAVLKLRHNFVRLFGLSTSVVIVDELHAYDAYMEVILERLVTWLGALRTPVVLLSATLPQHRRASFLRAYATGAGWPCPAVPSTQDYPLATLLSAEGVAPTKAEPRISRTVRFTRHPTADPVASLGPELLAAAKNGALVGWVRNTVAEAQAAWEALRNNDLGVVVTLFHARLRPADRAQIEGEVLARFGKDGKRTHGELLIATQVIEQSLDLDFDLLASDLCPIDLLLQRAGRLWRHERKTRIARTGRQRAELIVATPTDDDCAALRLGVGAFVYDKATLWLASDTVGPGRDVAIPTDLRGLVEDSYDPARRAARIAAAGPRRALEEAEARLEADLAKRREHARKAEIGPPETDLRILFGLHEDTDESAEALTRDGESVTLLLVHWDGEDARSVDPGADPWSLDPTAPDAWRTAEALLDEVVSVPAYPWERPTDGLRPFGESAAWEGWLQGLQAFLAQTGARRRNLVVVPMRVGRREGEYRGLLGTSRGKQEPIAYSRARGLWFPERRAPKWGAGVRDSEEAPSVGGEP